MAIVFSMARTKEFDVDLALARALDLFHSKGFEGTSMQELVEHLGINRGSLYATFGCKEEIYARAFDLYTTTGGQEMVEAMAANTPLRERLSTFLYQLITDPDGRGCFVVNTACERNHVHEQSRIATTSSLTATRNLFIDVCQKASDAGELREGMAPELAADLVLVLMQGMQVMATAGADQHTLGPVIEATLDQIT